MGVRRGAVRLLLATVLAAAGAAVVPVVGAGPAQAAEGTRITTPGVETWVVPAGITSVTFDVSGAAGGSVKGRDGGSGGRAVVTVPVTPGTTFTIGVGAEGPIDGTHRALGGGGMSLLAAGGGGASWVADATGRPVLVAGGGGGAGWHGNGGAGGAPDGSPGEYDGPADPNWGTTPPPGPAGTDWQSGNPGSGGWADGTSGGGGGGWRGGGAGTSGAGGSGGSSFGPAGTEFGYGVPRGNGAVLISYAAGRPPVAVDPGTGRVTSDPAGLDCVAGGSGCTAPFDLGSTVTLTAAPVDATEVFTGWGGACSGTDATCTVSVDGPRSVSATFARPSLTVAVTGQGVGDVWDSSGGVCSAADGACTTAHDAGSTVTLTAHPQQGSVFRGWSGAGCAGTDACSVTLDQSRAVTADFWRPELTMIVDGPGAFTAEYLDTPTRQPDWCNQIIVTCGYPHAVGDRMLLVPANSVAEFVGWSGGVCSGTDPCQVTMDHDVTVTAVYRLPPRSLAVTLAGAGTGRVTSTPDGIDCGDGGTACTHGYDAGQSVTLSAAATDDSVFTGWSGAGCSGTSACTVSMQEAREVVATFVPGTLLTVHLSGGGAVRSLPAGIDCRWMVPDGCEAPFLPGATVTLQAVAGPGEQFTGWTGPCDLAAREYCRTTMSAARTVTATFVATGGLEVDGYPLTAGTEGDGDGYVDAPDGIDCGTGRTACSASYAAGSDVTLTAHPDPGSEFTGWTAGCLGTAPTCTVTMDRSWSVTASFAAVLQPIAVTTGGSGDGWVDSDPGGIECGGGRPHCWWAHRYGTALTLTAHPTGGSSFAGWRGACAGSGATCTLDMTAARSTTAFFAAPTRDLAIATSGTGAGHVECDGRPCPASFDLGAVVHLMAVADPGTSVFAGWDGGCAGASASCTVTMDRTQSVTARFDLAERALTVATLGEGSVTCAVDGVTGPCGTTYVHGTQVDLLATAALGWRLAGWSGDGCLGVDPGCALILDRDRAVTAAFEPVPVSVVSLRLLPETWTSHTRRARLVVDLPADLAAPTQVSVVVSGTQSRSRTVTMAAGRTVVRFDGAWAERTFAPGRYRVTVRAADAAGRWSAPRSLHWRVRR